jgi:hypothetical protein
MFLCIENSLMLRVPRTCAAFGALLLALGCGGGDRAEVSGKVTRADGSPLVGARVIARSDATGKSANGVTDNDGHYVLSMVEPGDGVPAGDYKASIIEFRGTGDNMRPASISLKYGNPDESGLAFAISGGEEKVFDVVVDPLEQRR